MISHLEHSGQEYEYFIHCNYSGLGWLDAHGQIEREYYQKELQQGFRYVLWIPLGLEGCCRGMKVGVKEFQNADIELLGFCGEKINNNERSRIITGFRKIITSRCCNVDYTKRGKELIGK